MAASNPHTLVALWKNRAAADPGRTALRFRSGEKFRDITWRELAGDVHRAAAALQQLGVSAGDRVVQVCENRYEWIVADLAILHLGAIDVAVHAVLSGPQIAYQVRDSGAKLVIVSTDEQATKLAAQRGSLPKELVFLGLDTVTRPPLELRLRPLSRLMEEISTDEAEKLIELHAASVKPEDLATILYTSGTTGDPKGVMLTHANLVTNAVTSSRNLGKTPDDVMLCWLPLSHIFARTCNLYAWLEAGCEFVLAKNRDTVLADCAVNRPTLFTGVPYFFEKVHRHLAEAGLDDTPGSLRALLGGDIRICVSGGAALSNYVAEFFEAQEIPILQGYGLTESSPVISMSTEKDYRLGSVGRPLADVDVRISADGEIVTRGPHVMAGYWQKPEDTAEAVQDGWLFTGDLGHVDNDGFLWITGRKKELIVTAAGKNVAPVGLEALLCEDPLIMQAMIVGEGRNYLTALIVPEIERLREVCETGVNDICLHPQAISAIQGVLDARLQNVAAYEKVQHFRLIHEPFTIENNLLTPTLKPRRQQIETRYAEMIHAMYQNPLEEGAD